MDQEKYFEEITPEFRYQNEMMEHARMQTLEMKRTNQLLEQLILMINPQAITQREVPKTKSNRKQVK